MRPAMLLASRFAGLRVREEKEGVVAIASGEGGERERSGVVKNGNPSVSSNLDFEPPMK